MRGSVVKVLALGVLLLALGLFAGWQIGDGDPSDVEARLESAEAKLDRIEARRMGADSEAQSLVATLGRFCGNLDFHFIHEMARGAFRPVRCSIRGKDPTVLLAYGFDAPRTRQAWAGEWGNPSVQRGAALIEDETWAVEVLDPGMVEEVRSLVLGSP